MYRCETWTIKKDKSWRIDAFELWCWRRLENTLDSKEIKPVNLKGNQPWIFIGRTEAEAEAPILWPPDAKSQLIGKDPDAGKDWGQEKKGMIEDEMVGWHHQLNGPEFEQTPGDGEGQEAWRAAVHGGIKCWTRLSDWATTTTTYLLLLKKKDFPFFIKVVQLSPKCVTVCVDVNTFSTYASHCRRSSTVRKWKCERYCIQSYWKN